MALRPRFRVFIIFFCLLSSSNSIDFHITSFDSNSTNIHYEGDAQPFNGAIQLNRYDYITRVGRASYSQQVPIWDNKTGRLTDFTTHFSFVVDTLGYPNYGHGLAFVLAPVQFQTPLNSAGGFMALFNTTTLGAPPENHIVAVEVDSYVNVEWDPPMEHVGICVNTLKSEVYVPWNASLHSSQMANAWINYNSSLKRLSVYLTYEENATFSGVYNFSYDLDLRTVLPEWVSVGFCAATGMNVELNRIYSWEFHSSLQLQQRDAIGTAATGEKKVEVSKWMIGTVVLLCFMVGGATAITSAICWRKKIQSKQKRESAGGLTSINNAVEKGAWPRRFSYEELVSATNNFSGERKLGEGGFGSVYKGYLSDLDMFVAVKKISRGSKQGRKEYITEVKIISSLRHRNLVQLIGWCHDQQGQCLLVYEFMPNRSLDAHIFGNTSSPLAWAVRYKIVLGLASALLYLHEEWEQCVVHRDIKASNVMLDSGFNAKLGDFGLARLMDHDLGTRTTGLAGTWGYMAPEYISRGKASKESDVYSFGIVALEVSSGKKAVQVLVDEESTQRLVEWVWDLYGNDRLLEAVDQTLGTDFDVKQMERLLVVGLWCAHPNHTLRPSIKQAIQVLNFETTSLPHLPNRMPVPTYEVPIEENQPQSCQGSITYASLPFGR